MNKVSALMRDFQDGVRLWRIWSYMAWRDMLLRYRRSIIGPFWIAGSMATTAFALSIVFGGIFDQPLHEIIPYITAGLVVWQLVALGLLEGPELFIGQAGTMHNNAFPTSLYIFRFVLRALIVTAHNVFVLAIVLLTVHTPHGPTWQVVPGFILVVIFAFFLSAITGLVSARFRDLRFMLPQLGQLLFFLTPIFWRIDDAGESRFFLLQYNPMYYIHAILRDPIIGQWVPIHIWLGALGVVCGTVLAYAIVFAAYRRRLPFWI